MMPTAGWRCLRGRSTSKLSSRKRHRKRTMNHNLIGVLSETEAAKAVENEPGNTSERYEVIVLGGGKGGKTLATELGNKGVKTALIERSAEPGVQLLDMPDFPEAYKPEALGGREFLDLLRAEKILEFEIGRAHV